jgi:hypothetical protein
MLFREYASVGEVERIYLLITICVYYVFVVLTASDRLMTAN